VAAAAASGNNSWQRRRRTAAAAAADSGRKFQQQAVAEAAAAVGRSHVRSGGKQQQAAAEVMRTPCQWRMLGRVAGQRLIRFSGTQQQRAAAAALVWLKLPSNSGPKKYGAWCMAAASLFSPNGSALLSFTPPRAPLSFSVARFLALSSICCSTQCLGALHHVTSSWSARRLPLGPVGKGPSADRADCAVEERKQRLRPRCPCAGQKREGGRF
jgi:hypothetical protein